MTLLNRIIEVSSVRFSDTRSGYCTLCPPCFVLVYTGWVPTSEPLHLLVLPGAAFPQISIRPGSLTSLQGLPSRSYLRWPLPLKSPILSPCCIFLLFLETNIHYSLVVCVVCLPRMKFSFLRAGSFVCCSYCYKLCSRNRGRAT